MSLSVKCPECGQVVTGDYIDIVVHAVTHWHVGPGEIHYIHNPDARARYLAFITEAKKQEDEE